MEHKALKLQEVAFVFLVQILDVGYAFVSTSVVMSSIEALICGRGLLQWVDISIKLVLEVAQKLVENKVRTDCG
ncbi:hypothetical protein HanRHA438_Chr07g0313981 [Helianthus annuus]|uniref:Uncharacterized protein n=1 Tax=Helianthus annuus TaxID=4232 RepID=A0A9K3IMU5_HELAN|nr:hypothetical protein HanXRQr2_Chr07g0304081 [Helianthus annuus]KAJ0729153.1 hypothetical protein HanLR1_Chr07g0249761 [Helianthus annuus]KAJ0731891.1 hypothetical protein HanOQP8_Chr07g0257091 [Helianthus annuus]KAJ0905477.1 hypothetical protein HanPSC8_Chr07g0294451 [Helianthus annuus]KAJ0908755.1 hypothetical protein HanRHA438_Chr07g0313981 [Helianthus annuus]